MIKKLITAIPCIILVIFGGILFLINIVLNNFDIERLINKISNLIVKMDEWGDR